MAGKIFINYRRDDAKAEAARLHDRLAQSFGAANVFMDVDNLLPGERFDLRLKEALAGTDVFLAVIGSRWLDLLEARAASGERDYVREEIAAALAAKIVVIPVLMDRAPLPKAASLAEDIRELALYHKHDVVYESFGRDVQALIAAIEVHRRAREKQAAEEARLAREKEKAEIEAARRTRQQAKEEAEARHRAQMDKDRQAKPRPVPAALPWKPAMAIVAVAAMVILLVVHPWQRKSELSPPAMTFVPKSSQTTVKPEAPPAPSELSSKILAADAVAISGQPTPLTIAIESLQPFEKMLVAINGIPEGGRLSAGVDTGGGNWLVAPRRLNGLTINLPAGSRDAVSLEAQLLDSNARAPLSDKVTFVVRLKPEAATSSATPPRSPAAPPPHRSLLRPEVEDLIGEGNKRMREGDILEARQFYQKALAFGDAEAMLAMGRSYDPVYFARIEKKNADPDPAKAFEWYKRAIDAGAAQTATVRIENLKHWLNE